MGELTLRYNENENSGQIYTWQKTKLVLPFYVFQVMKNNNQTFQDMYEFFENYIKVRLTFCGNCSNSNVYIEYKNKLFSIGVYHDKSPIHFWDESGCIALGKVKRSKNDIPDDDFIKSVDEILNNYCENKLNCSGCGKMIDTSEIAGRFYAGAYCSDCWQNKWKEIEAKENYD